jgi:hypothetical protein
VNDEPLLLSVAGAHRTASSDADPMAWADAVQTPRARSLPKHRARRLRWKAPLEPVEPQHAYDRDAFLR